MKPHHRQLLDQQLHDLGYTKTVCDAMTALHDDQARKKQRLLAQGSSSGKGGKGAGGKGARSSASDPLSSSAGARLLPAVASEGLAPAIARVRNASRGPTITLIQDA